MWRSSAYQSPSAKDKKKRRSTFPDVKNLVPNFKVARSNSKLDVIPCVDSQSLNADVSCSAKPSPLVIVSNSYDSDTQKVRSSASAVGILQRKIQRTMELIHMEHNTQAEDINEYLEAVKADKPNIYQIKAAFEKKNQKTAMTISQLQSKLESYQKSLAEMQTQHRSSGPKEVLKNVSHNLKTMVAKPVGMIKNKLGSAENVQTDDNNEHHEASAVEVVQSPSGNTVALDKNNLTPKLSGMALVELIKSRVSSSQTHHQQPQPDPSVTRLLQEIQWKNVELNNSVAAIKVELRIECSKLRQAIDVEHVFCERLEDQLNDLTELHQHEIADLKQDIATLEEKMQYILEDKTRDLHDLLESCLNRVNKVEQQQHQQLVQSESQEQSDFSLAKIINFGLAIVSFLFLALGAIASLVSPFLSTRFRYCLTISVAFLSLIVWKNWEFISNFIDAHLLPDYVVSWLSDFRVDEKNVTS